MTRPRGLDQPGKLQLRRFVIVCSRKSRCAKITFAEHTVAAIYASDRPDDTSRSFDSTARMRLDTKE